MAIDYRIRFSTPRIDFTTDVGTEGQDIDSYPAPNSQARYDHMRMVILGLLTQQASELPPTQYRYGTTWFNLKGEYVNIFRNNNWTSLSNAIKLADTSDPADPFTLQDWYDEISDNLQSVGSEIFFHGNVTSTNASLIPIPTSLQAFLQIGSRPFVFVNGSLINPATTPLQPGPSPTAVLVPSGSLPQGSTFTVSIRLISDSKFNQAPVTI